MAEEKKDNLSLEALNQQFSTEVKKKESRKKNKKRIIAVLAAAIVVVLVIVAWTMGDSIPVVQSIRNQLSGSSNDKNSKGTAVQIDADGEGNESILTEDEQAKWKNEEVEVNGEKIFVELNTMIKLDGQKAYIRLINPIYSSYTVSVTIYPQNDEESILYQSEHLAPGTILEAIMLEQEPKEKERSAVVLYTVYDSDGKEIGTHAVDVEFTNEEDEEEPA